MKGYDLYKHYGIEVPGFYIDPEQVYNALKEIIKRRPKTMYYIKKLIEYLRKLNISIQEFIFADHYKDLLRSEDIADNEDTEMFFRYILSSLCKDHKILPLSYELCIVPDLKERCDLYDLSNLETGLSEAIVSIYPSSIIPKNSKVSILQNTQIPIVVVNQAKLFFKHYRTNNVKRDLTTRTLVNFWYALRKLTIVTEISDLGKLDGENGAKRLKEYFEKERTRKLKTGTLVYKIKGDSDTIENIKIFFNTMWKQLGMVENPFSALDTSDSVIIKGGSKILDRLKLPYDRSEYKGTKIVRNQLQIRVKGIDNNDLYIIPCFEKDEIRLIRDYIEKKENSIRNGTEPDLEKMDLEDLRKYHEKAQGDFILALGIFNGPRPLDYRCLSLEQIGKFSTDINDPINERFFNDIPTIQSDIKENPLKLRPEKRFFGPIFVLFAQMIKARRILCRRKNKNIQRDKNRHMNDLGEPVLVTDELVRISDLVLRKLTRNTLVRVGLNMTKALNSTIYFLRKAFIVYARMSGMPLEAISIVTGTDPKTLMDFYLYLDLLKDTNKHFAEKYLPFLGFKHCIPCEGVVTDIVPVDANRIRENVLETIAKEDECSIDEAIQIFEKGSRQMSRNMILDAIKEKYIIAVKRSNQWIVSKKSIEEFIEKYIDVEGIVDVFKNRHMRITKRRAQQVIKEQNIIPLRLLNKVFVDYKSISSYLDRR
ncbi:MAG: helix-turn-helix domain-containing protein [Elusimicrobia bacterium]|nr:helix-turn-helix domain-containing protein [Candidatus Liberimonas magnetica]